MLEELIASELTATDELLRLEFKVAELLDDSLTDTSLLDTAFMLLIDAALELEGVGSATQAANNSAGSASVALPSVFNIVMLSPQVSFVICAL